MPSIQDALNPDLSGYSPLIKGTAPVAQPQMEGLEPIFNPMMRCPLPVLLQTTGDSLRQFYQGGKIPQMRFLSSQPFGTGGGGDTGNAVISNTTIIGGNGGSGGSGNPVTPVASGIPAQQATVTTVISPGNRFTSSLPMAKSFQLLSLSAGTPCRIQMYGTAATQSQDASRALDVPPPAGTAQDIIFDVVLDTLPLQWIFQNRTGANSDNPQQPLAYITITNLGVSTTAIRVTVNYVALENV